MQVCMQARLTGASVAVVVNLIQIPNDLIMPDVCQMAMADIHIC